MKIRPVAVTVSVVLGLIAILVGGAVTSAANPPNIVISGPRAQAGAFNTAQASLPLVGATNTQGIKASNASGPAEPYFGSLAYLTLSSPQPGVAPYSSTSVSHVDFTSLAALGQAEIQFDMSGAGLVAAGSVGDFRGEGAMPDNDARLQATDTMFYYLDASGGNGEKRTYTGGTFTFINATTSAVIATGTVDFINLLLNYTTFANQGWGEFTVDSGTVFHDELVARFGHSTIEGTFSNIQSPVFDDSPGGTPLTQQYAVFAFGMEINPKGAELPPTATPVPVATDTPVPAPTDTPIPAPTDTPVPAPTDTPVPAPTDTPVPEPTATQVPGLNGWGMGILAAIFVLAALFYLPRRSRGEA